MTGRLLPLSGMSDTFLNLGNLCCLFAETAWLVAVVEGKGQRSSLVVVWQRQGSLQGLCSYCRIGVIDHTHQEQAMRWCCRAGVAPLTRVQNGGHRVSGELRPANGHECANNRTGHVLQKTICVEHKNEALGVSDDP
jgi:hypothetical protein